MYKTNLPKSALSLAGAAVVAAGAFTLYGTPMASGQPEAPAIAALQSLSDTYVQVAEQTSNGVVFIEISKSMASPASFEGGFDGSANPFFRHFFGPGGPGGNGWQQQVPQGNQEPTPVGTGSGFIISPDGYIVTNNHVAAEADGLKVTLQDGRQFDATVIGSDPQTEVALLKIDATGLPTVSLGDSDRVRVGEWVLAVGSPFGLDHTVTSGIISAQGRSEVGIVDYANFIQTDAAINPGNSGGPLINLHGEVIGMNTAILSSSGGSNGIGFAIPINMVKSVVNDLKDDGKIERGFLGVNIQNITPEMSKWFDIEGGQGALIAEVVEGSPAAKGGLQKDDVVVSFDGQVVKDASALRSRVATTVPNTEMKLEIIRGGERLEKNVTLGELDSENVASSNGGAVAGNPSRLGLQLQNLDENIAGQLGFNGTAGVVVAGVEPSSQAARQGIERGMIITEVNRIPVANVEEFKAALEKGKKDGSVLLNIHMNGHSRYVAMKLS
jgi:serine protease Do